MGLHHYWEHSYAADAVHPSSCWLCRCSSSPWKLEQECWKWGNACNNSPTICEGHNEIIKVHQLMRAYEKAALLHDGGMVHTSMPRTVCETSVWQSIAGSRTRLDSSAVCANVYGILPNGKRSSAPRIISAVPGICGAKGGWNHLREPQNSSLKMALSDAVPSRDSRVCIKSCLHAWLQHNSFMHET